MLECSNIIRIMKLTTKEEDYLETIYRLSKKSDTVGISDVARKRGVTLPTVISAVSRLKENGLVSQRHYGKIFRLTARTKFELSVNFFSRSVFWRQILEKNCRDLFLNGHPF